MSFNRVVIGGTVVSEPEFNNDGSYLQFPIRIVRQDIKKIEDILISIGEQELQAKALDTVKEGKFFLALDAEIVTKTIRKRHKVICPVCHAVHVEQRRGEELFVVVKEFDVFDEPEGLDVDDASMLPSGINKCYLLGNIASALTYRESAKDPRYNVIKFKMAINQDDDNPERADYPWAVSIGKEADNANLHLHTNDRILVEGSIQERRFRISLPFTCSECGLEAIGVTTGSTREIITRTVKYLQEKKKDEFIEMDKELGIYRPEDETENAEPAQDDVQDDVQNDEETQAQAAINPEDYEIDI